MKIGLHQLLAYRSSPIHALAADTKLLAALLALIFLITSSQLAQTRSVFNLYYLILAIALAWISMRAELPLRTMLLRTTAILPLVMIIIILNASVTGLSWFHLHLALRTTLSIGVLVLLSSTTPITHILQILRKWRVPQIFLLILSFIHRYAFLLLDEVLRMRMALRMRGYCSSWSKRLQLLAIMTGALFIRSYERAERVHQAMVMRGFRGHVE